MPFPKPADEFAEQTFEKPGCTAPGFLVESAGVLAALPGTTLDGYLTNIGKIEALEADEEVELAKCIESGLLAHQVIGLRTADDMDVARKELEMRMYEAKCDRYGVYNKMYPHPEKEPLARREAAEAADLVERLAQDPSIRLREWRRLAREGDRATEQLTLANLRLVVFVAKKFTGRGLSMEELVQAGNVGLIDAVKTFDYTRGYKFSVHGVWRIRKAIGDEITETSRLIRLPSRQYGRAMELNKTKGELTQDLGREPTTEELAKGLGWSPKDVEKATAYARGPVYLDEPVGENGAPFGDFVEDAGVLNPEHAAIETILRDDLRRRIGQLPVRQAQAVVLHHGLQDGVPRPYKQVGEVMGVSHATARRYAEQGHDMIRDSYGK